MVLKNRNQRNNVKAMMQQVEDDKKSRKHINECKGDYSLHFY